MLYSVTDNVVTVSGAVEAIGAGSIVALDLAGRMYKHSLSMKQAASLSIYIMDRVKSSVPGCGGNTKVVLLGIDGKLENIPLKKIKELEIIHADIELTAFEELTNKIVQQVP